MADSLTREQRIWRWRILISTYIGYGGTQSIDSPAPYSAVAKGLITELGIDVASYGKALDSGLYKSLGLKDQ